MHSAQQAEHAYLQELGDKLTHAKHGQKEGLLLAAEQRMGVTRSEVYRRLAKLGWTSGRKPRKDRGTCKLSKEETKEIAALIHVSVRDNQKQLMAVHRGLDVALANNLISERVSPTTLLRAMRRHGVHPSQSARAAPHQEMRSLYPNHVWQLDASICVLYYLRDGSVKSMDARQFNDRKPKNYGLVTNDRVLRYVATDHASGAILVRYFNTSGENTETLFEFLMWAFAEHADRVIHGVPEMMVWDAGAANQSHAIKALFTALGVRHWAHMPGQPRAKGQVEQANNTVERDFEGRLRLGQIKTLEQLNARADEWQLDFNANFKHSRHGKPRLDVWLTRKPSEIRRCPPRELCEQLMVTKPAARTVDGRLEISFAVKGFGSSRYRVEHVPNVRAGEQVMVAVNPYRAPCIWVVSEEKGAATRYIECEPVATDAVLGFAVDAPVIGQEFKSLPDTDVDTARKEMNEAAYGVRDAREVSDARSKGVIAFGGKIDAFADIKQRKEKLPTYLPRRGTEMDVPSPVQIDVRPLDLVTAMKELRARLSRPLTTEDNANVRAWYPDGVPETDLDALVQRLTAPAVELPPARAALQLVR